MPRQPLHLPTSSSPHSEPLPHQSAEAAISRSIARQSSGGVIRSLFTDSKTRQLRAELHEIEEEHAVELAISRVDMAADHRLDDLRLEAERRKAAIRDRHNARSGELAIGQAKASSEAIGQQIALNDELVSQIADSQCSDQDKALLMALAKEMAAQSIASIARAAQPSSGT